MKRSSIRKKVITVLLTASLTGSLAQAATRTFQQEFNGYTGTQDTELRGAAATTAQGAAVGITVDQSDGGGISHGLIRFDNIFGPGADQIPLGETIVSATLYFYSYVNNAQSANASELHRMLQDWSEADATWSGSFGGDGVQTDDTEAVATPDATFTPNFVNPAGNVANTRTVTLDVTASVQAWSAGAPNYGWAIIPLGTDGYRIDSSEVTASLTNRPLLVVNFGAAEPILITTQPADLTVEERQNAAFSVGVTGTRPVYQWFRGAAMILDATNSSFTLSNALPADSGATFHVEIRGEADPVNPVISRDALLTVNPDVIAPKFVTAASLTNAAVIDLTFSEGVNFYGPEGNVDDNLNWVLRDSHGVEVGVLSVVSNSQTSISLQTDALLPYETYLAENTITIQDLAVTPNVLPAASQVPVARFQWPNVSGLSQTFRYNDTGESNLAPAWITVGFDDSAWKQGFGLFDGKLGADTYTTNELNEITTNTALCRATVSSIPVATCLQIYRNITTSSTTVPAAQRPDRIITAYFRTHFNFSGETNGAYLRLVSVLDDSAIYYLNGAEIIRLGVNAGTPTYLTFANRTIGDGNYETNYVFVGPNLLQGDNVLAAEVHQVNNTSSDMTFGVEVAPFRIDAPPGVPSASFGPTGEVIISWAGPGVLVESDTVNGTYTDVAGNPASPYQPTPTPGQSKFYRLKK